MPILFLLLFPENKFTLQSTITSKYVKGSKANSVDPDQTAHNVASGQGLHCLLTGFSIKIE